MAEPARLTLKQLKEELDAATAEITVLKESQKILTQVLMELVSRRPR